MPLPLPKESLASLRQDVDFPAGLLIFDDAFCSFNPIYTHGITVAAPPSAGAALESARQPEWVVVAFFGLRRSQSG